MITVILFVLLVTWLIGALPVYPHNREWGYRPVGVPGILLVVLILLILFGVVSVPHFR